MDRFDIIADHKFSAPRGKRTQLIDFVETGVFHSIDGVLDDAVNIGNSMGADMIVGFQFQSTSARTRTNRTWSGFGTAIRFVKK